MTTTELGMPGRAAPARTALEDGLRAAVDGEVRFDRGSRATYSTDASNYRQVPIGVVVPRSVDDAVAAVEVVPQDGAPVLSRGGGTSLAGQTTNDGGGARLDQVLPPAASRSTPRPGTCVVEPGIVLDELNDQLARHGLMFGPRALHPPQLHHRRHDRQQLLRLHRAGLRQDGGQRAPRSRC